MKYLLLLLSVVFVSCEEKSNEKNLTDAIYTIYSKPLSPIEQSIIVKGELNDVYLGFFHNDKDNCMVFMMEDTDFPEEAAIELNCFTMMFFKRITSIECSGHVAKLRLETNIEEKSEKYVNSYVVPADWKNCKEFKINYRERLKE